MADYIYYFDKITPLQDKSYRHLLGEVQEDFNVNFVIDGTKDSARFIVHSYTDFEIQPFTIMYHANTNSWWIVSHDKVERHMNEDGFFYVHQLDLLGAIELFNARDLTDCGFRSNKYTVFDFFNRLFRLSNLEYDCNVYAMADFDIYQKVDYLKTFENYSLLSAIREFCDGYNIAPKLGFYTSTSGNDTYISQAVVYLYPKTGNYSLDKLDMEDFALIGETKTMDKNSFGSTVITNADNVVSTRVSRYPAMGVARLKSKEHEIKDDNGCIILPDNVYKAISLTLYGSDFYLSIVKVGGSTSATAGCNGIGTFENAKSTLQTLITNTESVYGSDVANYLTTNIDIISENINKACMFKFYDGFLYDAMNNTFKFPPNAPSDMKLIYAKNLRPTAFGATQKIVFTDKLTRDSIQLDGAGHYKDIYWERGSNLIRGFQYFNTDIETGFTYPKTIEFQYSILGTNVVAEFIVDNDSYRVSIFPFSFSSEVNTQTFYFPPEKIFISLDYIPMGDLKIKTENDLKTRDVHLYNQNGKMNDSVSLSKLINSYSYEISTDNITRHNVYYRFSDVPKVGQVVSNHGTDYIINNVSLDFSQNESLYYIVAEITMSKAIAVKSLMINANSNIRDYGIPQTNSVKRKQVYRDIFTFRYDQEGEDADLYTYLDTFLDFKITYDIPKSFIAFIKTYGSFPVYSNNSETPTGTKSNYYYQLETTTYYLKKQVIVKVDFTDNNIIGYDAQTIASNWSTNNFFLQANKLINTPVGYTDENGELTGLRVRLLDTDQVTEIYTTYATSQSQTDITAFYNCIFLDSDGDIFDLSDSNYTIELYEQYYRKDALEVPVFEYSCQLLSNDEVLVGDNILDKNEDENKLTFYFFYEGHNLTLNNALSKVDDTLISRYVRLLTLNDFCRLNITVRMLVVQLYNQAGYDMDTDTLVIGPSEGHNFKKNHDYSIYRFTFDKLTNTIVKKDVVLILKDLPEHVIDDNKVILNIMNYKL